MNTQIIICFLLLAFDIVMFMTEKIKPATTAIITAVVLALTKVLTPQEAFSGFINGSVLLFVGMFVISGALFKTGMAHKIANLIISRIKSERNMIFVVFLFCGILSAFLPNLGTCAVMMPIIIGVAETSGYKRSRLLMAMIYGSTVGGTATLIGTVGNTTIAEMIKDITGNPVGFFEFTKIGGPMLVAGAIMFYFWGDKILPGREAPQDYLIQQTDYSHVPPWKQWTSLCVLVTVVLCIIFDVGYDLYLIAAAGGLFLLITGIISEDEAISSIQWKTIFLVAGMLPMSTALNNTGAGAMIANTIVKLCGNSKSPLFLTAVIWIICNLLTQIISNTATTMLMAPIGIAIAETLQASPVGVLMAVLIGSSCAFMTPIGQGGNTMIFDVGGYKFSDYIKSGWQITLLCFIVSMISLSLFFPFFG